MIQLNDTSACLLRDELKSVKFDKKITLKQIEDRLTKTEIPNWLEGEIIEMVEYRKFDRCTSPVEQAMYQAVCNKIVDNLMKSQKYN